MCCRKSYGVNLLPVVNLKEVTKQHEQYARLQSMEVWRAFISVFNSGFTLTPVYWQFDVRVCFNIVTDQTQSFLFVLFTLPKDGCWQQGNAPRHSVRVTRRWF